MSSITGLAQFTNRFAQNMMNYNDSKDKERERLEDKSRELERQRVQDQRAQESHDTTQRNQDLSYEDDKLIHNQNVIKNKALNNSTGYEDAMNKARALQATGQTGMAVAAVLEGVNSNSNSTYTIDVDRDENGVAIELDDGVGNKYYKQSVIDKDTGLILKTNNLTYDQIINSYTQLQNGQSIAESEKEAARLRAAAIQKNEDELNLFTGKAKVDAQKHAANKAVDYGYTAQELSLRHGNTLDLEGVRHGYRTIENDQRSANSINQTYATAGINQGQTPNITGGGSGGGTVTKVLGAGAGWTKYQLADGSVVTAKGNRNFRNNNVGNIEYGSFAKSNGAVGSDGRFAVFATPEAGVQAMENLLFQGNSYKNLPLNKAIGRYAPAFENDTKGYANTVLNAVGGQNKKMSQYSASERRAIVNAMISVEGKNNVTYSGEGGVKVTFDNPIQPKAQPSSKSSGSKTTLNAANATPKTFNAQVDKGVNAAFKSATSYGLKKDPATMAAFAQAGGVLKSMTTAKSYEEFIAKYEQAGNIIINSMPEARGKNKKLTKAQENALVHNVLLSMAGATSLGDFKDIMYSVNPAVRGAASTKLSAPMLPGQQPRSPSKQASKLQALSVGIPNTRGAGVALPSLSDAAARASDSNNNIDW